MGTGLDPGGLDMTAAVTQLGTSYIQTLRQQSQSSSAGPMPGSTSPGNTGSAPSPTSRTATSPTTVTPAADAGHTSQSVAYRQGYQAAREDPDTFVPATGENAEQVIAARCATDSRSFISGAQSQAWIDGCFAGTLAAVDDRAAAAQLGTTDEAFRRVGYETGREHQTEIAARQGGDLSAGCRYEAHLAAVPTPRSEAFVSGCVNGATQAAALAVPTTGQRTAPMTASSTTPTTQPPGNVGDLGLDVPITKVRCDSQYIVIVGSAVDPDSYPSDVQRFLSGNPGTKYLRTDQACSSLVQDVDGNPIYAVFQGPFPSQAAACAVRYQIKDSTVKRLVESGEPMADEQCG